MEHTNAIETMAPERYVLGEMSQEESDAFEEHFFDCTECTQAVRDGVTLAAGVRALGHEKPVVVPHHHVNWWAAAAAVFAAAVIIFWWRPQPPTETQRVVRAVFLSTGVRGAGESVVHARPGESIELDFDIMADPPQPPYRCQILDAAGHVRRVLKTVTAAEATNTVSRLLPPGALNEGSYTLEVRGGDRVIASYPFIVWVQVNREKGGIP